jgi:predicted nuclease of predicted toxin-antitoxin system
MKILLDENFPLRLYQRLIEQGREAEHIVLSRRGMRDQEIIQRLQSEELLFLTQDQAFTGLPPDCVASVIVSHVRQTLPIEQRVGIWLRALRQFLARKWPTKLFEVYDDGELLPIDVRELSF